MSNFYKKKQPNHNFQQADLRDKRNGYKVQRGAEMNTSSGQISNKERWEYAMKLLDYVYRLKIEADNRAQSILNTNTLLVAILAVAATLLVRAADGFNLSRISFWVFLCGSALGVLAILLSQLIALSAYSPIVEDRDSRFEPEFIRTQSVDQLSRLAKHSDLDQMLTAISQECIAVAKVQVKREQKVKHARRTVTTGLFLLLSSLLALGLNLWGY